MGNSSLGSSACVFEAILLLQSGPCYSLLVVSTDAVIGPQTKHDSGHCDHSSILDVSTAVLPDQMLLAAE